MPPTADLLPSTYRSTRSGLHRVAAHILARRRFDVSGHFGLRASPGGFATPAFGADPETLRVAGTTLVREMGGASESMEMAGSTLRDLASFAGTDLEKDFSCGDDTPALGDIDVALDLDAAAASVVAGWYDLGWQVLDIVVAALPAQAAPVAIQLWPEHFDAGTHVGLSSGERVNLGFSPGDSFETEPYAYLGPWSARRPGDPSFWNAPFGAVLRRSAAHDGHGAHGADGGQTPTACRQFMEAGLEHLLGP